MRIAKNSVFWTLGGAFAIFVLAVFLTSGLGDEEKKGLVTFVNGSVKKKAETAPAWIKADKNTELISGDQVRTYRQSRAELELLEMDVIRMAPQTTIDIIKLYEETQAKRREVKIHLEKGDIWATINKKENNSTFDISTPITVAAITGTSLRITSTSDSLTQLKVYSGEVNLTNAPDNKQLRPQTIQPYEVPGPHEIPGPHEVSVSEWMYIIKSMQQITVNKSGQIVNKGDFSLNDIDEQTDWVKWNRSRDRELKR